jgi:hypothetical protein
VLISANCCLGAIKLSLFTIFLLILENSTETPA